MRFYQTSNIKKKQVYARKLAASERPLKVKAINVLSNTFKNFPCVQLLANKGFCTKTKLCNFFQIINAKTLIKVS